MKRLSLFLCAAALAAVTTASAFADSVVFNQPLNTSALSLDGNLSEYTDGQFVKAYDHFSLAQDTTVSSIEWSGLQMNGKSVGYLEIAIYADNGEEPGDTLFAQNTGSGDPVTLFQYPTFTVNQYSAATDVALDANTEYWISIVAYDPVPFSWYWGQSLYGDNGAEIYYPPGFDPFNPSGLQGLGTNLAFELIGSPTVVTPPPPPPTAATPEPSSLFLMGSGMLTMAGMARRRLAQR